MVRKDRFVYGLFMADAGDVKLLMGLGAYGTRSLIWSLNAEKHFLRYAAARPAFSALFIPVAFSCVGVLCYPYSVVDFTL